MNNYYQMSEKETLKKLKTTKEGLTTKEAVKRIKLVYPGRRISKV